MNIIGCLDSPTSGKFRLNDEDVSHMDDDELAEIRNQIIGFIFQQYNLLAKLTVQENVQVSMQYAGISKKERTKKSLEVLTRVGLEGKLKNLPTPAIRWPATAHRFDSCHGTPP